MKTINCPHCGKELTGNHNYEVRCYHCGRYSYLLDGLPFAAEKARLHDMAAQYAYAYVPKNVREYVDKYGLAQSGPTILKWFKDNEAEAKTKLEQFVKEHVTTESLRELHREYTGKEPFLLFVLDHLNFPIERASLEWDLDSSDSSDF
ncbi:hypothetical protein [Aneurinibacillus terranovensis]|uniref:hypothetical protein n=1 Tax=Aneurinibacillus terranovensis TaxID=278991 RepID=UPI0004252BB2|nr:hypothetical protein [Aneurinibacillus terranovensis]